MPRRRVFGKKRDRSHTWLWLLFLLLALVGWQTANALPFKSSVSDVFAMLRNTSAW